MLAVERSPSLFIVHVNIIRQKERGKEDEPAGADTTGATGGTTILLNPPRPPRRGGVEATGVATEAVRQTPHISDYSRTKGCMRNGRTGCNGSDDGT